MEGLSNESAFFIKIQYARVENELSTPSLPCFSLLVRLLLWYFNLLALQFEEKMSLKQLLMIDDI